jgi:flagellar protein FlgJ
MISASNAQPQDVYTDLNSLQSINKLGRENKDAALRQVAEQFESMFVKMMMKSMRDANKVFSEDSLLSSPEGDFYQQMYDDQLAVNLSSGSSLGLADVLYRQLSQEYGDPDKRGKVDWASIDDRRQSFKTLIRNQRAANDATSEVPLKATQQGIPATQQETSATNNPAQKVKQFDHPDDFVAALYPAAQKVGKEIGVNPLAIVSQAALETGWGKHMITDEQGNNSFNFFGIKADSRWDGDKVSIMTHEYRQGVRVNEKAEFRAYDSMEEGLRDYGNFLQAQRYSKALEAGENIDQYAQHLQQAGYATDPQYAAKIQRIAVGDVMQSALQKSQGSMKLEVPRG